MLSFLFPLIIAGLVIFGIFAFVRRLVRRKRGVVEEDEDRFSQIFLSKEDAVSQFFFLLSIVFLSATLLAFNYDFGSPVSWRIILYIASILGLIIAYYYKSVLPLGLSLIGIAGWWGAQTAFWAAGKDISMSSVFVGLMLIFLILYVLGHLHEIKEKYKRFAMVYLIFGIITVIGALFFLSTQSGLEFLDELDGNVKFYGEWRISISLILFAVVLIGTLFYTLSRKLISGYQVMAVILLAILFCSILFTSGAEMFVKKRQLTSAGVFWAVVYNIVIFFAILGLIFSGYIRREKRLINLGAIFLFLLILVKYFDWFFQSLDKSIFFIGAGILLFVVGWFMEKGRRRVISKLC
ncbi:MAG: hypothetical protein CMI55_04305 [Parcubacteria group bacterium]|jgi:uncharacterized membrane protein|nr:hypothetical protein [Parcubacteria group bacterium]|tara:strand:+ start:1191 stop:2243 length:1053 start_codon:yes stop_codon:yes gene_type:complete